MGERSESFLTDAHGRDHHSRAALALADDGRFLALKVETIANIGAAVSAYAAFVPTWSGAGIQSGVYDILAVLVHVRGALTNTAPVDAYRGAGRPETACLLERLVDKAARETGLGPVAIRRRNFIPPSAMPYRTAGGRVYDSGEFNTILTKALNRAEWADFPARRAAAAARGRWRGIGLAYYIEICAGGTAETATVEVNGAGQCTIRIGTQSTGQGHETAFAQMTSAALGVPVASVSVLQGDTDAVVSGGGTSASRTLAVGGGGPPLNRPWPKSLPPAAWRRRKNGRA